MVHSYLWFITRLRLQLPLGSRMGCVPIFAIVIAIPIHPIERNRNHIRNRNRVINRRCEWTLIMVCSWLLPPANEVCEGYIFTGVCLSMGGGMHGGGHVWQGEGCVWWGRGVCGRGCMAGGMQGRGGVCATADTTGYGQWAGGTHPTGMHSC